MITPDQSRRIYELQRRHAQRVADIAASPRDPEDTGAALLAALALCECINAAARETIAILKEPPPESAS